MKGYYRADYFVLEGGGLQKVPLVVEVNLCVSVALCPAWGSGKRLNACDSRGASSLRPSVTRGAGEWRWVGGGRPFELGGGPELLFPLAVQMTEAEYVLALKAAWHFSCINVLQRTKYDTA